MTLAWCEHGYLDGTEAESNGEAGSKEEEEWCGLGVYGTGALLK